MQVRYFLSLLIIGCFSASSVLAQEQTLEEYFDEVYNDANDYQEFKVVKKADMLGLKQQTLDSLATYREALEQMQSEIESQQVELDLVQETLANTEAELEEAITKENSIYFIGIPFSKTGYNALMWGIAIVLLLLLLIFIYKFKNSNHVTKETIQKHEELEKEFEGHRQSALEREQQLNRKLLDEKNKNN